MPLTGPSGEKAVQQRLGGEPAARDSRRKLVLASLSHQTLGIINSHRAACITFSPVTAFYSRDKPTGQSLPSVPP